jgi:hypothetical protein
LIIVCSIKITSLVNGYGSISHRAMHVIVVKRHSSIGEFIMLFLSFFALLEASSSYEE